MAHDGQESPIKLFVDERSRRGVGGVAEWELNAQAKARTMTPATFLAKASGAGHWRVTMDGIVRRQAVAELPFRIPIGQPASRATGCSDFTACRFLRI